MISPQLYERSLEVKQELESGQTSYRAISTAYDLLIADCIHALAAVDPDFGRDHYPLIRVGNAASRYIARQIVMRSQYDQHQYDYSWLLPVLGIDTRLITVVHPRQVPKRDCLFCACPEQGLLSH